MRGEAPDPRDDVYALGVIWYQMLVGDVTAGRPGGTRWQKRLTEQGLSAEMVELLAECFEDGLDDRVSDAAVLAKRLGALLPSEESKPVRVPTPPQPTPTPVGRSEQELFQNKREQERSLSDLDEAVRANPEDAGAWSRRGEAHRLLGKHDQAVNDCTEAIRIDPQHSQAYATRAPRHRMKGELDLAVADCSQAIRLDPSNMLAWYNRGEAYRLKGDLGRAIADCTEALRLDPAYSWAYGSRGAALRQKGELTRAIADLDENIRLDPDYAWAWAVRGEAYRLQGEFDRAIADCTEALRLQPNYSLAYATRGARRSGRRATSPRRQPICRWRCDCGRTTSGRANNWIMHDGGSDDLEPLPSGRSAVSHPRFR